MKKIKAFFIVAFLVIMPIVYVGCLISAIINFSWSSIILIPYILINLSCYGCILMLCFSENVREEFRQTINQAHDVI